MNGTFFLYLRLKIHRELCWGRDEQKTFGKIHVNTELDVFLNSAVFFLVRKFYMLRCLFGTLYVEMRCFGVSWVFSKHKIPHPNQWGILKPQRNTVYSRKTSE